MAETRPPRRLLALAALIVTISAAMAGCSSAGDAKTTEPAATQDTSAWVSTVQAVGQKSTNTFVQQVTADGTITKAELDETFDRLRTCMKDRGYERFRIDLGANARSYAYALEAKFGTVDGKDVDGEILLKCQSSSGDLDLTPLYAEIWSNPQNKDLDRGRADCLNAAGIGPGDITAAQAQEAYTTLSTTGTNPIADDDRADACLKNPFAVQPLPAPKG